LPAEQRRKVIILGVVAALVLRIAFALVVSQLLQIVGLVLAGGLLLLWVAWRMWRESLMRGNAGSPEIEGDERSGLPPRRSFASPPGRGHRRCQYEPRQRPRRRRRGPRAPGILIVGLILSVALMGIAANVSRQIYRALSLDRLCRLAVIMWVALKMVWDGYHHVAPVRAFPA
jgi:predicted tellurium resistance membrane protein TerC